MWITKSNNYGLVVNDHKLYYDFNEVEKSLKHDGWNSIDDIREARILTCDDWLFHRCKPFRKVLI